MPKQVKQKGPEPKSASKSIKMNLSNLDRTTILGQIRYAYRTGYDEMRIYFKNIEAPHLRKDERHHVREIIHHGIIRLLLGVTMEVVDEHNIILRVNQNKTLGDLPQIMKQVILKLVEMHADLLLLVQGHLYAANSIEEKHDSITRLASHCTRMLTVGTPSPASVTNFHIISNADKIADLIKYMARDYLTIKRPMSRTSITVLKNSHECLDQYRNIYSKGVLSDISDFSLQRDEAKRQMRAVMKSIDSHEAFIMGQESSILEVLTDMMESDIALKNSMM